MSNYYISGGQVFLHRVRMFLQVLKHSIYIAFILGIVLGILLNAPRLLIQDYPAIWSYQKAQIVSGIENATGAFRSEPQEPSIVSVTSKYRQGAVEMTARQAMNHQILVKANDDFIALLISIGYVLFFSTIIGYFVIFFFWYRFGRHIGEDREVDGKNNRLLSEQEVRKILFRNNWFSSIAIGTISLIKDTETRHTLVTGSTGSGKTNLLHAMLPQVREQGKPAIIIDQTGEMIAKYYDEKRGDVIINPLDKRGHQWDFWGDIGGEGGSSLINDNERLERFAKILFTTNAKRSRGGNDLFWSQAAESIFVNLVQHCQKQNELSLRKLFYLVNNAGPKQLEFLLKGTDAQRFFGQEAKGMVQSILAVMAAGSKPLRYLTKYNNDKSPKFTLRHHFKQLEQGSTKWLFLATKPSSRELTMPLISALTELAALELMSVGINDKRRLWLVIDELSSLGNLPALPQLMAEGRKYGACILAALQSLNQLYHHYGNNEGSVIFGQFATKFFFRSDEPQIARLISDMCGEVTIMKHQKNTSFGAHEFRDGVSYTEQEKTKKLVEYNDIASLKAGEAYLLLPEPKVRLSRIQIPKMVIQDKNQGFVQQEIPLKNIDIPGDKESDLQEEFPISTVTEINTSDISSSPKVSKNLSSKKNEEYELTN